MDIQFRLSMISAIQNNPRYGREVTLHLTDGHLGEVQYDLSRVWRDPLAPGFNVGRTSITDEELVRAYLIQRLADMDYPTDGATIEIERVYKSVGRTGKGGRADVVVRGRNGNPGGRDAFLFIECKAPDKFDSDMGMIDGQLFRLSMLEQKRPKYLAYYTVEIRGGSPQERLLIVDTDAYPTYDSWTEAGQPITDSLPRDYGAPVKKQYGYVTAETNALRPLDKSASAARFNRIRNEIHDVIWGGGGTNNNEVFVLITRLILAKIYDENNATRNSAYRFQRKGSTNAPEPATELVSRLNGLYKEAEAAYLSLRRASSGPAFDESRISAEKIAYVVGRLEGISVTENTHGGDLLGEFFEQIVSSDFTQTKGQFFTPVKIIRFMLELANVEHLAAETIRTRVDQHGRPYMPYVIDPSAGSGSFLIEYMHLIHDRLGSEEFAQDLPRRVREYRDIWFSGMTGNAWAKDFLFGIENNYDLGLAAKVNMVLHGDGSANTWIQSGLSPFPDYWLDGRNNILASEHSKSNSSYRTKVNEQFDLILSNPPFSLKLSDDEKRRMLGAFDIMRKSSSEAVFIERWYQLLQPNGSFCCVLPEAIVDTSTGKNLRYFLLKHFAVQAVISLPYDSFRPFTSTKCCIMMARKRTDEEVQEFDRVEARIKKERKGLRPEELMFETLQDLGWAEEKIFMAEPDTVGYKRRRNLPDLPTPNQLYPEDGHGEVDVERIHDSETVISRWREPARNAAVDDCKLGFRVTLADVARRPGLRLDPKYRWLWDMKKGKVGAPDADLTPLSSILKIAKLSVVEKGELSTPRPLIDLEAVISGEGTIRAPIPLVDTIGSDRVSFDGCDLIFSKLEPYLAKVVIDPDPTAIGSTEWVGLSIRSDAPALLVMYFLMQPAMRDTYRRLQSGKRHARLDPEEMLELLVPFPPREKWEQVVVQLKAESEKMERLRREIMEARASIDQTIEQAKGSEGILTQ